MAAIMELLPCLPSRRRSHTAPPYSSADASAGLVVSHAPQNNNPVSLPLPPPPPYTFIRLDFEFEPTSSFRLFDVNVEDDDPVPAYTPRVSETAVPNDNNSNEKNRSISGSQSGSRSDDSVAEAGVQTPVVQIPVVQRQPRRGDRRVRSFLKRFMDSFLMPGPTFM